MPFPPLLVFIFPLLSTYVPPVSIELIPWIHSFYEVGHDFVLDYLETLPERSILVVEGTLGMRNADRRVVKEARVIDSLLKNGGDIHIQDHQLLHLELLHLGERKKFTILQLETDANRKKALNSYGVMDDGVREEEMMERLLKIVRRAERFSPGKIHVLTGLMHTKWLRNNLQSAGIPTMVQTSIFGKYRKQVLRIMAGLEIMRRKANKGEPSYTFEKMLDKLDRETAKSFTNLHRRERMEKLFRALAHSHRTPSSGLPTRRRPRMR